MTTSANADPQIITREVAREQKLTRFFTGEPCKRGHVVEREVSRGQCIECKRELDRKRRAANPEKERERVRKDRAANPEKYRERERKRYAADPDAAQERVHKRRAADPEKFRKRDRKRRADNGDKMRAYFRKQATLPLGQLRHLCATTAARLELGSLRHSRFKLLGYGPAEYITHLESTLPKGMTFDTARAAGYHVDHIVPLTVISEACPRDKAGRLLAFRMAQDLDNLQMIPGTENISKNDSFDTEEQRALFDVLCSRYLT